jgi:hypothetical protein
VHRELQNAYSQARYFTKLRSCIRERNAAKDRGSE